MDQRKRKHEGPEPCLIIPQDETHLMRWIEFVIAPERNRGASDEPRGRPEMSGRKTRGTSVRCGELCGQTDKSNAKKSFKYIQSNLNSEWTQKNDSEGGRGCAEGARLATLPENHLEALQRSAHAAGPSVKSDADAEGV